MHINTSELARLHDGHRAVPRLGWGVDLFESTMKYCSKCVVALGGCNACKATRRVMREVKAGVWRGERCETCDGAGSDRRVGGEP